MSAAPVSRSSALSEMMPPSRRTPERSEPDQAFVLPQDRADAPRARLDDDRGPRQRNEPRTAPSSAGQPRRAADAETSGRALQTDRARRPAGTDETSDQTGAEPGSDAAPAKTAGVEGQAAAGSETAKNKAKTEIEAAPIVLPETVVAADSKAELPAVPVPAPQAVPVPDVAAAFLALAALAVQGGEPAKQQEGAAATDGKPQGEVATASAMTGAAPQQPANAPVIAIASAAVGAQAGPVAGEAGAPGAKAGGSAATIPVPASALKAEPKPADAQPSEAEAGNGLPTTRDGGEAGKPPAAHAGSEMMPAETRQPGQAAQAGAKDEAAPAAGAPQPATVTPQALPAAPPQSLTLPQAPLTELDAAAQATAQAQAEAAHRSLAGEAGRPTPLHVVPVEIGARALAGNKRFDIRLDPAELGRIDVSLEISDKGDVSAKLTVDRVETLHLLQRDARTLERAFEQAGLKPSEGGIDLSLRDPGEQQAGARQHRQDEGTPRGRQAFIQASDDSALVTEVASLPRNASRLGGVDLSI